MKNTAKRILAIVILVMSLLGCAKTLEEQIAEQLELGQKYLLEKDYEEAVVAFTKVIELEEKEIQAYTGLATAYIQKDDRKQAETVLDQGFAVVDTLSEAERTENVNQYIEEMYDMALSNYEELLELAGENVSEAISYCEKILAMDEDRVEMYEELAKLYLRQGEYDKAIEVLDRGSKATKDSGLEEYKNQLELEKEIEERYDEAIQNMVQYLDSHDGELGEEVLMDEKFRKLAQELKEPLIKEYQGKYIGFYPGGYIYYGEMNNGVREGEGKWYYGKLNEVTIMEGNWNDDMPNGPAIINKIKNEKVLIKEEGHSYALKIKESCNLNNGVYNGVGQIIWEMDSGETHEWDVTYINGMLQAIQGESASICNNCPANLLAGNSIYQIEGLAE